MSQPILLACAVAIPIASARAQDWDLSGLPAYEPASKVSGTIRNVGMSMNGLMEVWEKGFLKFQPDIRFEDKFPNKEAAVSGLYWGAGDLGPSGREPTFQEWEGFATTFKSEIADITVATGTHDVQTLNTWSPVIFVHKDNPIAGLTMKQLDGIYGSERTGSYVGRRFAPEFARGPEDDIRTWGQLGLTGEWADKPIHAYGYAFGGVVQFFQLKVLKGGDKWSPNYRVYLGDGDLARLDKDKYGIAWNGMQEGGKFPQLKQVALAADAAGPYVAPTLETLQNRTYPLARSMYIFLKHAPGEPLEPKLKEFLRYVLSRQGQEDLVGHKHYLPLTPELAREQLKKLE